jgi:Glycosyl hydrolases family 2, TIM barrel domain
MSMHKTIAAYFAALLTLLLAASPVVLADKVTLKLEGDRHQLLVNGEPFFVKGAGGGGPKDLLKQVGGNAFRTWGVGPDTKDRLDEAQALGLKVALGIWVEHERHGFNYDDPTFVASQFEKAKKAIDTYKDHPALLCWSIGNEMDGYKADGGNPKIWQAVEQIAAYAKQVDPDHPTMTVVAEILPKRVEAINTYLKHIDIVGINTYAGGPTIGTRYIAAGGVKPYMVTEFGPPGTWEIAKNDWNAVVEPTSSQKAAVYREAYEKGILAHKDTLCLGSFVFIWGHKQEATATWFGMFLPDGSRLAAVDTMQELWSGKPPANKVPVIDALEVAKPRMQKGETFTATLKASDPENDPISVEWMLAEEAQVYGEGGDAEPVPTTVKDAIIKSATSSAQVKLPNHPGRYRLFVVARDGQGGAATANVSLLADGAAEVDNTPLAPKAKLPLIIYGDDQTSPPYAPAGWMGLADKIAMDDKSTDNPKSGATCLKASFNNPTNFGGVVWQSPASDWGEADGGYDLRGAKKLTFWARGAAGGEKVEFKYGILDKSKAFYDTASGAMVVTLTPQWKQYTFDLIGKDLRRIKTGFVWVLGDPGKPVTFYLDEIRYE